MPNIGIIILAAGESRRMGSPKQILPIEGKALLRRTTEIALATHCEPIVLVLGANKPQIAPEIIDLPLTIIDNPMWHQGLSSSVKMGMAGLWITTKDIDAVMILVCDQPYLSVEILNKMIEVYKTKKPKLVGCRYGDEVGVPVLFDKVLFGELLNLTGEKGAKPILMNHLDEAHIVDFEKGEIDLDTPEDYQKWRDSRIAT